MTEWSVIHLVSISERSIIILIVLSEDRFPSAVCSETSKIREDGFLCSLSRLRFLVTLKEKEKNE